MTQFQEIIDKLLDEIEKSVEEDKKTIEKIKQKQFLKQPNDTKQTEIIKQKVYWIE